MTIDGTETPDVKDTTSNQKKEVAIISRCGDVASDEYSRENLLNALDVLGYKAVANEVKEQFLQVASALKLNPWKREIYMVPFKGSHQLVVGFQVYIKRAELSDRLNGWQTELVGTGKESKVIVTIYRKDWQHPFKYEAFMTEFYKDTPIWREKPRLMLTKCAIGNAFRVCFPTELAGIPYVEEEMLQADKPEVKAVPNFCAKAPEPTETPTAAPLDKGNPETATPAEKPKGDANKALKLIPQCDSVDILQQWKMSLSQRQWEDGYEKLILDAIERRQLELAEANVKKVLS